MVDKVPSSNFNEAPSFRTGLGKSVAVKQSSITRALAILHDEEEDLVIPTGSVFQFLIFLVWGVLDIVVMHAHRLPKHELCNNSPVPLLNYG